MMRIKRLHIGGIVVCIALLAQIFPILAQDPTGSSEYDCEFNVIVQADDWLSKIADKFLGNLLAFPAIVVATNHKSLIDDTYTYIADANVIEPGWKLCIPNPTDARGILNNTDKLDVPAPTLVEYNGLQWVWEWEGQDKIGDVDWYFDILIYHSFNDLEPYATLVSNPENTQYLNEKWYSDLGVNFRGCSHWAVRIAKRDSFGKFVEHISPESDRMKVGPCGSTFSSPIR